MKIQQVKTFRKVRGIGRPPNLSKQNLKMGQSMSIEKKESCSVALQVEVLLDFFAELRVDRHHLIEKKQKTDGWK